MRFFYPFAALRSLRVLSALLVGLLAGSSASATNMSTVDVTLLLTFQGAVFTSSGLDAEGGGNDYEDLSFDYSNVTGLFELGTGAQSSTTSELTINGTDWSIADDIVAGDVLSIVFSTMAEATGAGSEFTASLTDTIDLSSFVYVEDSLTFLFDYEITWAFDLDEPDPGQALGVVEADVDGGPLYVDIAFTGPDGGSIMSGDVESGSFGFEIDNTLGDMENFQVSFNTRVVSNAQVVVPEPSSLALLASGALLMTWCRRRSLG